VVLVQPAGFFYLDARRSKADQDAVVRDSEDLPVAGSVLASVEAVNDGQGSS
jgi:hypothetical protein